MSIDDNSSSLFVDEPFLSNHRVPDCVGLVFFMNKFIERKYVDIVGNEVMELKSSKNASYIECVRRGIGQPLLDEIQPVQVIIISENGLDDATCSERAIIASYLWRGGVRAEYLAQTSVMLSLLRHFSLQDWSSSVERVSKVAAILNIPFVVVMQPHLFKAKGVVKLRQTTIDLPSGPIFNNASDELVPIAILASVILDRLGDSNESDNTKKDLLHQASNEGSNDISAIQSKFDFNCLFVDSDQYYDGESKLGTDKWKQVKKVMRTSSQNVMDHLCDVLDATCGPTTPLLALDLHFRVVRDVGSLLIFEGIGSLNNEQLAGEYPQHKKIFRNLMYCLDALVRKYESKGNGSTPVNRELSVVLYSIPCEKYDIVSIPIGG